MEAETIITPETAPPPPDPPDMAAVRTYYVALQTDLSRRVSEIETFLGFAIGVDALSARVAKLESFLGVK